MNLLRQAQTKDTGIYINEHSTKYNAAIFRLLKNPKEATQNHIHMDKKLQSIY